MAVQVHVEDKAVDRMEALGLSVGLVERVVRRADAEANMCTSLDPPSMEGLTRWGRTTRFLRESLVSAGWTFDNPRNLARTVHPDGEFAIVATSGDEMTGQADQSPTTKYPKGYATVEAVEANDQLTLDFGDFDLGLDDERPTFPVDLRTWYLLYHVDDEGFRVELSLPNTIEHGWITNWQERIIFPVFLREGNSLANLARPDDDQDPSGDITVEVNRR
ncbi:MAG: hypothetical protein HYR62_05790 [Actinobacteria bacterium]|nr:hypothetical protein [Actinomycetota bacterium]MBI3688552.1 hypothetical protein [Actinomycetota bacterium]